MVGRFLFTFAVQMQAVVLGWQVYSLTQDPLYLGFVGLAEAIPALSLALFAGYVVDRNRPLRIYRRVLYVSLLSGLMLFVGQGQGLGLTDQQRVAVLFLSSILTGVARAFSQPSVFALVPRLVARAQLARASAWMSSAMQTARISGPAIGGLLYGFVGIQGAAVAICASLLAASFTLAFMKPSSDISAPAERGVSVSADLLSGAVFVFKHPLMFPALALDMISVLFGGVTALLPIYAAEILHVGPKGLGLLRASPALGASVMSFVLASVEFGRNSGRAFLGAVAGFGVCILVFALSRDFMLSMGALTLSGAFDSVSVVVRTSLVQLGSPDAMRGRISAVNSMFIGSSNELGEFESGLAAKFLGAQPAAVLGAAVCLLTVGLVALCSPNLRSLDLGQLRGEHKT